MKRHAEKRKSAKREGRRAKSRNAAARPRRRGPILEEPALVRATARAAASIKTSLREEPAILAEEALQEAEHIRMLLADQEVEEDQAPAVDEDEEPFLRPRPDPSRTRSRPAPAIVRSSDSAA